MATDISNSNFQAQLENVKKEYYKYKKNIFNSNSRSRDRSILNNKNSIKIEIINPNSSIDKLCKDMSVVTKPYDMIDTSMIKGIKLKHTNKALSDKAVSQYKLKIDNTRITEYKKNHNNSTNTNNVIKKKVELKDAEIKKIYTKNYNEYIMYNYYLNNHYKIVNFTITYTVPQDIIKDASQKTITYVQNQAPYEWIMNSCYYHTLFQLIRNCPELIEIINIAILTLEKKNTIIIDEYKLIIQILIDEHKFNDNILKKNLEDLEKKKSELELENLKEKLPEKKQENSSTKKTLETTIKNTKDAEKENDIEFENKIYNLIKEYISYIYDYFILFYFHNEVSKITPYDTILTQVLIRLINPSEYNRGYSNDFEYIFNEILFLSHKYSKTQNIFDIPLVIEEYDDKELVLISETKSDELYSYLIIDKLFYEPSNIQHLIDYNCLIIENDLDHSSNGKITKKKYVIEPYNSYIIIKIATQIGSLRVFSDLNLDPNPDQESKLLFYNVIKIDDDIRFMDNKNKTCDYYELVSFICYSETIKHYINFSKQYNHSGDKTVWMVFNDMTYLYKTISLKDKLIYNKDNKGNLQTCCEIDDINKVFTQDKYKTFIPIFFLYKRKTITK